MWLPATGRVRHLAVTAVGAALLAAVLPSTADAAPTAPRTECAVEVGEAAEYVPVRSVDLPEQAPWAGLDVPYAYDVADTVGSFDRVGYCLELDGPSGRRWVWTSMEPTTRDAGQLGIPTTSGQVTRHQVDELTVRSNVASVPAVTRGEGWLEMWPNSYRTQNSEQVAGSSADVFDTDDQPYLAEAYGSFQVHAFHGDEPATTAFAVNGFTAASRPLDIGIGPAPDDPATSGVEHPDWTFAGNSADHTTRRLTVYVRPGLVDMTELPQSRQLYARADRTATSVTAPISGRVVDPDVTDVELTVTRGSASSTRSLPVAADGTFATSVTLPVALVSTDLEVRARGAFGERLVARAVDVVAGDAFLIHGQSNAVARIMPTSTSSEAERSPWIRSFGSSEVFHTLAPAYRSWHYAAGDIKEIGFIGQWGLRMAHRIVDTYQVPVAVINGAQGGRPINHFQRDEADPTNQQTNYGRLLSRLQDSGLAHRLAGVLWYQGESDRDNADVHVAGFTTLLEDMRSDFAADVPYYVHQVRTSPCGNGTTTALRDAQRRMAGTLDVTVLSTNGLDAHDGCHFNFVGGYRELGDHNFAVVARDLYDGSPIGVAAPDPLGAVTSAATPRIITLKLRNAGDDLTVDAGVAADFRVNGLAIVSDVGFVKGVGLELTLTEDVPVGATVAYLGHLGAGPWVTNATGAGLLTFADVPVVGAPPAP